MKSVIIAGPKSSGKTTLFEYARKKLAGNQEVFFQEEINPYTFMGGNFAGGVFTDRQLQQKIMEATLATINKFLLSKTCCVWETSVLNLAYVKQMDEKWYYQIKDKFLNPFMRINPVVVFIETAPARCWRRRKDNYLGRIKKYFAEHGITEPKKQEEVKQKRLQVYKDNLYQMHYFFKDVLTDIPCPVYIIDNDHDDEKKFLADGLKLVKKIINEE
ncbi:MAG: hypothetical protein GXP43_03640 [bacterium]|nr:hypothetical protein [bacterium]